MPRKVRNFVVIPADGRHSVYCDICRQPAEVRKRGSYADISCLGCQVTESWTLAKYRRAVAKATKVEAKEVSKIETPMAGVATKNLQGPKEVVRVEENPSSEMITVHGITTKKSADPVYGTVNLASDRSDREVDNALLMPEDPVIKKFANYERKHRQKSAPIF